MALYLKRLDKMAQRKVKSCVIYHNRLSLFLSLPLPLLLSHWNIKLIKPQKMPSDASGLKCGGRVRAFIWTHVESRARKVQSSTVFVVITIQPLLHWERHWPHKQTLRT